MAFDILDGWPNDGALTDNVKPKAGEDIIEGMIVQKDAAQELVKADGTTGNVWWAVQNQSDSDVKAADKMPVILSGAILLTDRFEPGAYNGQLSLEVSATPGFVAPLAGGTQIEGVYSDGKLTRDGIEYLKVVVK